jgi:hypothetical protein
MVFRGWDGPSRVGTTGARQSSRRGEVGIWHETYRVRPGDYEGVYVNMTPFGLGRVGELVDAIGPRAAARDRLAAGACDVRGAWYKSAR